MSNSDPNSLSLKGRLSFLAKDSILYGSAGALNKAFALIVFPILARHFSVSEYGTIDIFTSTILLLTLMLVFGQDSAVARFFYEYKDELDRKEVISQSFLIQCVALCVILPFLWLFSGRIGLLILDSPKSETLFKLALAQIPFLVIINFSQNILKWSFNRVAFLTISIGSTVIGLLTLLIALLMYSLAIEDVFVIQLFTRIIFSILGLWFVRNWLIWPRGYRFIKAIYRYAIPMGLVSFIGSVMPIIERTLVLSKIGSNELGYYAVAVKISMFLVLPIQAFQMAWGPFSLSIFKEEDSIETFNWILKIFTIGIFTLILAISMLAPSLIYYLASERYLPSASMVFPMLMSLGLEGIAWITMVGIAFSKRSLFDLISCVIYVLVSTIFSYFLITNMGYHGVAWGSLSGTIIKAIIGTIIAQRLHYQRWQFRGVFLLACMVLCLGLLGQIVIVEYSSVWGNCIILLTLVLLWFPGLNILFTPEELEMLKRTYRSLHYRWMGGVRKKEIF